MIRIFTILFTLLVPYMSFASDNGKLPLPRFAAIKSNEVNARTGPGIKYPIDWVFIKKGEPVEIIAEYEQWRQVKDIKGEGGWVHLSVLSGKRSVIVTGKEVLPLLKYPENNAPIIAKITPHVRCQLSKCVERWCKVSCSNLSGWLTRKSLWGVYPNEQF